MIYLYFVNLGYFSQDAYADFDEALAAAKAKGFEALLCLPYRRGKPYAGYELLASWSIIGGLHDRRTS